MRARGIGLIILLVAFVTNLYPVIINYKWTLMLLTPKTPEEMQTMANELNLATLIGLVTSILAIVGIIILLIEFIKHEHPHEHRVTVPRPIPPPPLESTPNTQLTLEIPLKEKGHSILSWRKSEFEESECCKSSLALW
mgnify:CR=1 FL=1